MQQLKKLLAGIGMAVLIAFASYSVGWHHCKQRHKPEHDTVRIVDYEYVSMPTAKETIFVPVPADVDSDAVIRQYFAQSVFCDTFKVQDLGIVTVADTVTMNSISGRGWAIDLNVPTYKPPSQSDGWKLGVGGIFNLEGGAAILGTLSHKHFGLFCGYDFVNRSPVLGAQYIINL